MGRTPKASLRAKGTLISEPLFSTPCDMRCFPRDKGKMAVVDGFFLEAGLFPVSRGINRMSQRVENRGSLISVPLALRFRCQRSGLSLDAQIAKSQSQRFSNTHTHKSQRKTPWVCDPSIPPEELLGPPGPRVGNGVENEFPGPSGPAVQKVENRVKKESKELKFQLFSGTKKNPWKQETLELEIRNSQKFSEF